MSWNKWFWTHHVNLFTFSLPSLSKCLDLCHSAHLVFSAGFLVWSADLPHTTCGLPLFRLFPFSIPSVLLSISQSIPTISVLWAGLFVPEWLCVCVCVRAALFHGLSESSAISCIVLPLIEAKSGPLSGIAVCSPVCLCVCACTHRQMPVWLCFQNLMFLRITD